jgi:uncharacterized protein (TIGR02271 family)
MAKTLVGLYDTFADAEQVVQDLVHDKFARHDISLATHEEAGHHGDYTYSETSPTAERKALVHQLMNSGVPEADASMYAEGVRRGGSLVVVKASDTHADRGLEIMSRANLVDIDQRVAHWRQEGWERFDPEAAPYAVAKAGKKRARSKQRATAEGEKTVPVVEEELTVGKREVERGRVRIHVSSEERPVEEHVQLREERVIVDRHPVDRVATEADLTAVGDDTIEVTETAEEAVVSKRARVVEEVTVRKEVAEHQETVRDTVRHTNVGVEQVGAHQATEGRNFEMYAPAFRQHHTSTFADRDGGYEMYEPAYRYGYDLAANPRYRGRDWAALEADVRRDWEARHVGTWERYRDAIYFGWEKSRIRP